MEKFNREVFDGFKVDLTKFPTAPSLSYGIYKSTYLKVDYKIPILLGKQFRDISHAYYGGITDYYKVSGDNVKSYDINSLYPHCMAKYPMPVGVPTTFGGDPYKITKDPFGFFYVGVRSPQRGTPFLPYKYSDKENESTIYPTGTWSG